MKYQKQYTKNYNWHTNAGAYLKMYNPCLAGNGKKPFWQKQLISILSNCTPVANQREQEIFLSSKILKTLTWESQSPI
jgi:hypothetical protein